MPSLSKNFFVGSCLLDGSSESRFPFANSGNPVMSLVGDYLPGPLFTNIFLGSICTCKIIGTEIQELHKTRWTRTKTISYILKVMKF